MGATQSKKFQSSRFYNLEFTVYALWKPLYAVLYCIPKF